MPNNDLRKQIKKEGYYLWQVADMLNISEPTIIRKLRHELSKEEKEKILKLIQKGKQ